MNEKAQAPEGQPPDFESALKELESLVEKLEGGELDLDASLAHFRRGVELSRRCQALLEQAQQSVEALSDPDNPDSGVPFSPDAEGSVRGPGSGERSG